MKEILVADIECDGLYDNVTKIHCIAMKKKDSNKVVVYHNDLGLSEDNHYGTIQDGVERLAKADLVIGHNWIDYDCRVIKKFYPNFPIGINRIRDTLLRSYLSNPGRQKHKDCPVSKETIDGRKPIGAHSLENFGYIVGRGKVEHEDWTKLTEEMIHRCVEDVHITDLVDNYLSREMGNWGWEQAETIEKWFRFILSEQEGYGVLVDQDHIDWSIEQLGAKINKIDKKVLPMLPVSVKGVEKPTQAFKKDGAPTAYSIKYLGHTGAYRALAGDYCKVEFNVMNLGSTKQVKDYLISKGWKPENWNYKKDGKQRVKDKDGNFIKTSPKMKDESGELDPFHGISGKIPKSIVKRMAYAHRRSQIQGWKDRIRSDGRLGAGGNSVGTNTGRVTHRTVVNVPKAEEGIFFGKEMRSTFIVPEGYKMVGADLSALENRVAAHYTYKSDGGEFAHRVLKECPHQYIADELGIERSLAKRVNYGIMYGAGVAKVQSILGCTFPQAKVRYGQWWSANPALKQLREKIKRALVKHPGYLKGIDGRKIFVRSEHSAMNALFQNAGSMIFKVACIMIYKRMRKKNIRGHFVLQFHDEVNAEIHKDDTEKYSKTVSKAFKDAGEYLNLNVPMEGNVMEGETWAEVH